MVRASTAAATGVTAAACAALAYAVRAPGCAWLDGSACRGSRERRALSLTFDDGPSESTPELLDVLAEHGVPATFFLCGANVRRLPAVARRIAAAGHELGNHSDTHAYFPGRSAAFIRDELRRAQQSIANATGCAPRLFRPPYGARWFGLRDAQREAGLHSVMWTVLALDWKLPEARIAARVLAGAVNGAILCLHDGRGLETQPDIHVTIRALQRILPVLRENGYHFEKVSDILCPTT